MPLYKASPIWRSWVPTWTNLDITKATLNYAQYIIIDKIVHFRLSLTLTDAAVSGSIRFSLPVTGNASYASGGVISGQVVMTDTGTLEYVGTLVAGSASAAVIRGLYVSGSNVGQFPTSATSPFTWTNTDIISIAGNYAI